MTNKKFEFILKEKCYAYAVGDGAISIIHHDWVDLRSLTTLPEGVQFNNHGWVDLRSLTTLPEGVQFNNHDWVDLRSLTEHDAYNCGENDRKIKIINGDKYGYRVSLGCFIGTEAEAVAAIRKRYGEGSDYEAKVVAAFAKYKND